MRGPGIWHPETEVAENVQTHRQEFEFDRAQRTSAACALELPGNYDPRPVRNFTGLIGAAAPGERALS